MSRYQNEKLIGKGSLKEYTCVKLIGDYSKKMHIRLKFIKNYRIFRKKFTYIRLECSGNMFFLWFRVW